MASAGDSVVARLADNTKLFPRGVTVKGRITHLERRLIAPHYILISFSFFSLETKDGIWQCEVKLPHKIEAAIGREWDGGLISHTDFPPEGTLVFQTPHGDVVIPRGFESAWVTVKAPG
jgi:hypothetical protein